MIKGMIKFIIRSKDRIETMNILQPVRVKTKVGRNHPCPCNSGKKYKNCCIK
jgi:uncharacterized protein YecA (UPF0149 family)